ncbi:MAG: hypothetical protein HYZ53_29380 [Planctomycetes bacterium]|nr:hypothetical protein [Planctomycetota bacterium]
MKRTHELGTRVGWTVASFVFVLLGAALLAGCTRPEAAPERQIDRGRHEEEAPSRGTSGTNVHVALDICNEPCAWDRTRCNHGDVCGCKGNCHGNCGGKVGVPHAQDLLPGGPQGKKP